MDSEARRSQHETDEQQVNPVAGIWACSNCGRRIQVITASETPKLQPFTCVCGTAMDPGEEHNVIGESETGVDQSEVVDD